MAKSQKTNKKPLKTSQKKVRKKPQKRKNKIPKFNLYWIYGIIAFFMFSMLITNEMGSLSLETNEQTLIYDYIKNKDVEKIEIIQNKNIARIYIKEESLSEHRHETVRKPFFGDGINSGPHYFLKIGTSQEFRDRLDEAQENFHFTKNEWAQIFYNNEQSIWDSFWAWMPFIFLIFIWLSCIPIYPIIIINVFFVWQNIYMTSKFEIASLKKVFFVVSLSLVTVNNLLLKKCVPKKQLNIKNSRICVIVVSINLGFLNIHLENYALHASKQ